MKIKIVRKYRTYQTFFPILADQVPVATTSVPDPHHFGMLDPIKDLHQSEKHDPDPHQSKKVEAFVRGSLWSIGRSKSGEKLVLGSASGSS